MKCTGKLRQDGQFKAKNKEWFYRKLAGWDMGIVAQYLQANPKEYNNGVYQTESMIRQKWNSGFYDDSFVVTNAEGKIYFIAVYHDHCILGGQKVVWGSTLFLEKQDSSVAIAFMPCMAFYQGADIFLFEAAQDSFKKVYESYGYAIEDFDDKTDPDNSKPHFLIAKQFSNKDKFFNFIEIKHER
jgi:hypothetical protein